MITRIVAAVSAWLDRLDPGTHRRIKVELTLGSDQAKPLLFQGLFARERCYLALEPHFPYRNGRHKAAPALEEYTNRPPRKPGDVVL